MDQHQKYYIFNNQKNCVGVYFVCHHMFVDTFSINIIRNEINDFYCIQREQQEIFLILNF